MGVCPVRRELSAKAQDCLVEIKLLTQDQIECLKTGDTARLMALDKKLEMMFGQKERSFGALRQHVAEHGC